MSRKVRRVRVKSAENVKRGVKTRQYPEPHSYGSALNRDVLAADRFLRSVTVRLV